MVTILNYSLLWVFVNIYYWIITPFWVVSVRHFSSCYSCWWWNWRSIDNEDSAAILGRSSFFIIWFIGYEGVFKKNQKTGNDGGPFMEHAVSKFSTQKFPKTTGLTCKARSRPVFPVRTFPTYCRASWEFSVFFTILRPSKWLLYNRRGNCRLRSLSFTQNKSVKMSRYKWEALKEIDFCWQWGIRNPSSYCVYLVIPVIF